MQGLSDGVAIFVGKAHRSEKPSGVIIGKDLRLVIDFTDWNAVALLVRYRLILTARPISSYMIGMAQHIRLMLKHRRLFMSTL